MDVKDMTEEQMRVAMASPEHLKRFFQARGQRFLVFRMEDLIDAGPWPQQVELIQALVFSYEGHRRAHPSGMEERFTVTSPTGERVQQTVPVMKDGRLTVREIDLLVDDLMRLRQEALAEGRRKGHQHAATGE